MDWARREKHRAVVSVLEGRELYEAYVSSENRFDEEAIEGCDAGKKCCLGGVIMVGQSAVVCEECGVVKHYKCAGRVTPPKDGKWTCRACKAKLKAKKKGDGAFGEGSTKKPAAKKAPAQKAPAPKKPRKRGPWDERRAAARAAKRPPLARVAVAFEYKHNATLALICEEDGRWTGEMPKPLSHAHVDVGYPMRAGNTVGRGVGNTVGNDMFRDTEPSKKGVYKVYKFRKINYKAGVKHQEKTNQVIYMRKVEESDIPAIKKKWPEKFA